VVALEQTSRERVVAAGQGPSAAEAASEIAARLSALLPGHVCLGLAGQEGEAIRLLLALDEAGIAVSTGSACSANHSGEPSYVLQAMGFDPIRARGSLRITLGRFNTDADVDQFLALFPQLVTRPVLMN